MPSFEERLAAAVRQTRLLEASHAALAERQRYSRNDGGASEGEAALRAARDEMAAAAAAVGARAERGAGFAAEMRLYCEVLRCAARYHTQLLRIVHRDGNGVAPTPAAVEKKKCRPAPRMAVPQLTVEFSQDREEKSQPPGGRRNDLAAENMALKTELKVRDTEVADLKRKLSDSFVALRTQAKELTKLRAESRARSALATRDFDGVLAPAAKRPRS